MRNSGIYKIDFPNGKVYIGLTCDLKRRIKEHNTDSLSSLLPVHKAIKKYGRIKIGEQVTLIEEIASSDKELMQEREKYWIKYYDANNLYKGYNLTDGGDGASSGINNNSAKLNEKQIAEIYDLLSNSSLYIYQIAEKYNISSEAISEINNGKRYYNEELQYPLREKTTFKTGHSVPTGVNNHLSKFTEQDIELIYDLLINDTSLSLEAIGKKMNVSYGTISNINRGIRYTKEGYTYPLRKNKKKTNKFVEEEVLEIYSLLQSELTFKEIANLKGCSIDTIKRLNCGQTYYHDSITYPIKKN